MRFGVADGTLRRNHQSAQVGLVSVLVLVLLGLAHPGVTRHAWVALGWRAWMPVSF
eukprot:SAG22_NODE_255_length_13562_cov_6.101463_15_plen_56_part_00